MIVSQNLKPSIFLNHHLGKILGVSIQYQNQELKILNVYAPNTAKERSKLWKELYDIDMDGDWCLIGDFNMVERRIDRNSPSSTLVGIDCSTWNLFKEKWALIDVATIINGEDKMTYVILHYPGSSARLD